MTNTKTLDDYMNDPDIIDEPMALREIHAIRLKIYDETKGMTASEYNSYVHERASRFLFSENPQTTNIP